VNGGEEGGGRVTATTTGTTTEPTTEEDLKRRLAAELDELPAEALAEVASFLAYQRYKVGENARTTPYEPVALGGLWKGLGLTTEDLDEARREMWADFGERDF
jgi:hypothetical protein